jgi:hypothetical protein
MTAKIGFDDLRRRLKKALRLAGDTHTIEDIQQAIERGDMQCFVHGDSFVLTEIAVTPRAKYLNVFLAVGNLSLMALQEDILKFAEESGCQWMQTLGRHGWKTILPHFGWQATHTLFIHKVGHNGKV